MADWAQIRRRCEMTIKPMLDEFENVKPKLKEIARHIYPQGKRGLDDEVEEISHRVKDDDDPEIVNLTPVEALRVGAAGFLVNLMNPAQKWVHLEPSVFGETAGDNEVAGGRGSRSDVIESLENLVKDAMAKSGSYRAYKKMFEHLLAFGFAAVVIKEHRRFVAKAECLRVGTYTFGCGEDGKVNRLERRFAMTAEEIVRTFGGGSRGRDAIPEDVLRCWRQGVVGSNGNFVVENLIEPNEPAFCVGSDDPIDYGIPKSAKYRSVYWLKASSGGAGEAAKYSGVLAVRPFKFNPIVAPRLDCELGDVYGRGRGHDALNSCRGLQAAMMDVLEIVSNRAEPPVIASNELRDEGLNLGRGGVTYANVGEQRGQLVYPVLPNPPTSNDAENVIGKLEQQVRAAFFNGEFATIDSLKTVAPGDKRTAAEINALKSENLMLLGGYVLMLDDEAIDPIVNTFTAYALASKAWKSKSGGLDFKVDDLIPKYVSNLHLAQRTQEINSTENSVMFAMNLAQSGDPRAAAVLDLFDYDRIVRRRHKLVGGSELDVKNEEEVEREREARKEAQEQAQAQAEEAQRAETELQRAKASAQMGRAAQSVVDSHILGGDVAEQLGGW